MLLAAILAAVSIVLLCWLVYTLAALALPLLVGALLGHWAFLAGAGFPGASLVGFAAGASTLFAGQLLLMFSRSVGLRSGVTILFVAPAAVAGFSAAHGYAAMCTSSAAVQKLLGLAGGICVALSSAARLSGATSGASGTRRQISDDIVLYGSEPTA